MKIIITVAIATIMSQSAWSTPSKTNVLEETLYQNFKKNLKVSEASYQKSFSGITHFEQKLYVDALWDLADDGDQTAIKSLDNVKTHTFTTAENLRIAILRLKHKRTKAIPELLVQDLMNTLRSPVVEVKIIYLLAAYEKDILDAGHTGLILEAKKHNQYFDITQDQDTKSDVTQDSVYDLVYNTPDTMTYMNGEYINSVKIFTFCRENRLYPCLMIMKDTHGEIVRNKDGSIWTHKSLASAKQGLPSYTKNGNTPAGIFTIDSVMPVADQQVAYGKFRRLILNFIPKSQNEVLLKSLLPPSSHDRDWWSASTTARDIGRNLFRIHGTLKLNTDQSVPYYPFMRTSGCLAQRENTYHGKNYQDQRELLDMIMVSMDLVPNYENEVKAKGILYLVEIDDKNSSVEIEDLTLRGIE